MNAVEAPTTTTATTTKLIYTNDRISLCSSLNGMCECSFSEMNKKTEKKIEQNQCMRAFDSIPIKLARKKTNKMF